MGRNEILAFDDPRLRSRGDCSILSTAGPRGAPANGQSFLGVPGDEGGEVELTWNWDEKGYGGGRNFGHLAYQVDDIYETCRRLMDNGVTINRPPRDGRMAFVRTPDEVSVELLQKGAALPPAEPWTSMPNTGEW